MQTAAELVASAIEFSIIGIMVLCGLVLLVSTFIEAIRARRSAPPPVFHPNIDISGIGHHADFTIPYSHRPLWLAGIVVCFAVLTAVSFIGQRTDEAVAADAILRDPRLPNALRAVKCDPPDAPLEQVLVTIGTQADGKEPEVACAYITADLGIIPRIKLRKPAVFAKAPQ